MNDILLVLDMQRQQAEADLLALTRRRDKFAAQIAAIKYSIANKATGAGNLFLLEKWRQNQIMKIGLIKRKLSALEPDIYASKKKYKTFIAKNIAAKDASKELLRKQALCKEEQETSASLDTFLLTRSV
ncbi:MAG: hypothetical protein L3J05_00040 [Robiginitomaculum sp.]|nr:hypothetical protein [Robiginitomaculum sp.]